MGVPGVGVRGERRGDDGVGGMRVEEDEVGGMGVEEDGVELVGRAQRSSRGRSWE